MTAKDYVYQTLKDITFDGKIVPVIKNKFTGGSTTYIYYYVLAHDLSHADDCYCNDIIHFTADIFTSNADYDTLVDTVVDRLQNAGFIITDINGEIYETDTKLYHIPISFCIERYDIL